MDKKKRQQISLEIKYEMCQMRKRGDTPSKIGKHFEIKSSSTVSTYYAWRHTTQQTLQNCWRKAGFKAHQYEIDEEGFDIIPPTEYDEYKNKWNELNRVSKTYDFNQDEYITVDDAVPFAGALTDEEIVALVLPALEEIVEEEENETSQEAVAKVSNREAIKTFESLKLYLTQSSEDRSASLKLLERIEKDLVVAKAQSSIKDFFSC